MDSGCPACGYENPLGARFCSSCGVQLREAAEPDTTVVQDPTASHDPVMVTEEEAVDMPDGTLGMFVVRQGPKRGSRIALDSDTVSIGRHPESDIFLDDVTVSRRHAVVAKAGSGFTVSDAGSLNGTYVNRSRVETVDLNDGDEVQVGKFKLLYVSLSGQN